MSARFKKGDVVRVVCHDIREARDSSVGFNRHMERMIGEVHVIDNARERWGGLIYFLEGERWMWREDWLEPAKGKVNDYE